MEIEVNSATKFPKLRTYKTFKSEPTFENYLIDVKDLRYRKAIAKFRTSSHCLGIETGRYEKIPAKDRIC